MDDRERHRLVPGRLQEEHERSLERLEDGRTNRRRVVYRKDDKAGPSRRQHKDGRQVVYRMDDRAGPSRRQHKDGRPRYEFNDEFLKFLKNNDDIGNDGLEVNLDAWDRWPSGQSGLEEGEGGSGRGVAKRPAVGLDNLGSKNKNLRVEVTCILKVEAVVQQVENALTSHGASVKGVNLDMSQKEAEVQRHLTNIFSEIRRKISKDLPAVPWQLQQAGSTSGAVAAREVMVVQGDVPDIGAELEVQASVPAEEGSVAAAVDNAVMAADVDSD